MPIRKNLDSLIYRIEHCINIQMLKEVNFYPLEHRFDIIESEKKISVPFGETIKKGDLVVVWHNSQKLISGIDPSWKCQSSDFVDNDTYRNPGLVHHRPACRSLADSYRT